MNLDILGNHYRKVVKALASSNKLIRVTNNEMNNQVDFMNEFDVVIILYHKKDELPCEAVDSAIIKSISSQISRRIGDMTRSGVGVIRIVTGGILASQVCLLIFINSCLFEKV